MGGLILLDTTPWGTSALAVSKVHYLVIITVDPYVPYYIIVHEWIYIRTQMQKCIWTISQPPVWSSRARSHSSPRSICRQASSFFVFKSWRWMRVRSSHNASLARRMANSISLWSPSIVFCIASSCCCTTFCAFSLGCYCLDCCMFSSFCWCSSTRHSSSAFAVGIVAAIPRWVHRWDLQM